MVNIADNKEFRAVVYDLVKEDYGSDAVETILDAIPQALAIWLRFGGDSDGNGQFYGRNNEFIFRLNKIPEQPGHGVAEGTTEAEHYALHIKASGDTLSALAETFGIEVKNG